MEADFSCVRVDEIPPYPIQCSELRKEGFVILKGRPCQIVEISTSEGGIHLVGTDVFTQEKYENSYRATDNIDVPRFIREDYKITDISDDGYLTLQSEAGEVFEHLKVPGGELGKALRSEFDNNNELSCTVLKCYKEEQVIAIKPK